MAITDFEAWFDETIDDFDDAYCLYMAVTEKTGYGIYDVEVDRFGKIFVSSAASSDTLMIASEAALDCLIKMLEERWCEEGLSMEAQYNFIHAMRKDD
ncbi:MAG: hypothetical protein II318_01990 [Bacteroidales bacterium]|nr:hypothetical protein [Bacteroidales bacterium]